MQLGSWEFVEMEVGRTVVLDDPTGAFSVTTYDANHCPGNVFGLTIPFLSMPLLGNYKGV
jgi:DNA cross-link repair 1A protein